MKTVQSSDQSHNPEEAVYNVNLFRLSQTETEPTPKADDFKVQVLVNNHLDKVLADTGAGVSVCGLDTAKKWNLLDCMSDTKVRIKPYNSNTITAVGVSNCGVSFGDRTVPVQWFIIKESCEPILAGRIAQNLGIIDFNGVADVLVPVNMIHLSNQVLKDKLQSSIASMPELFDGVGCLKGHVVKLPVDHSVKPVATPSPKCEFHTISRVVLMKWFTACFLMTSLKNTQLASVLHGSQIW